MNRPIKFKKRVFSFLAVIFILAFVIGVLDGRNQRHRAYRTSQKIPYAGVKAQTFAYNFYEEIPQISDLDSIIFQVVNEADGASVDYKKIDMASLVTPMIRNEIDTLYFVFDYLDGGGHIKATISGVAVDSVCEIDYGSWLRPVKWSKITTRPLVETNFIHYFDSILGAQADEKWVPQTIFRCIIKGGGVSKVLFQRAYDYQNCTLPSSSKVTINP